MNKYLVLFASLVSLTPLAGREPAFVKLYCTSPRFEPASAGAGQTITFQITTDQGFSEMNGELAPFFDGGRPTHGALFRLDDPSLPDAIAGQIAINTPDPIDENGNGFDDFFESSQAVAANVQDGVFETALESGTVVTRWSRAAGSTLGTCRLRFVGENFERFPEFAVTFQLLEYQGILTYTPGEPIVGSLGLVQTGNDEQIISGPMNLDRVATDRFNELLFRTGTLTNIFGGRLVNLPGDIFRDEISGYNYYGFVDFEDGEPETLTADYLTWVISIDDFNDTDADEIPDLSDDAQTLPTSQPRLALTRRGETLLLNIQADRGRVFDLEETLAVSPAAWTKTTTITLTNSTRTVVIPLPNGPTRFWRLRAP